MPFFVSSHKNNSETKNSRFRAPCPKTRAVLHLVDLRILLCFPCTIVAVLDRNGKCLWRRSLTRYLSGPTNVSSILAAIVFFFAFFVRVGSGIFGGPPAAV